MDDAVAALNHIVYPCFEVGGMSSSREAPSR